ncbi:hypothetical protein [Prosthecobacter sp.]|uniref:hypothetical protein n=1 Tax=Prosthecobacter sp. TaxID=1965333 RepID=UPI001DFB3D27|nr:hypothetical protein [Prosthecobacter sp.]MCB1277837.1 hypothetical protein [Prosthecobacter sp.]
MKLLVPLLCAFAGSLLAADVPAKPIAKKGELLFSDDFERTELGEWAALIPAFSVQNGVLKGLQARDDHGAVGRVYRPMKDIVVEFKFKLDGSTGFNAVFDDQKFKGSHAGHICRVAFAPKQIRLGDDKEGVMRNDIFEMRKDPTKKAQADKLLDGRGTATSITIDPKTWHDVAIEISGDQMRVSMDGKPVGHLQSPGIAHETKSSFHFTVNGPGVLFDDVRIWKAE